ncbi:hypothetical protein [Pseudotamlana agarivorans]|uniref:hypothetical protein n=1 Tax=Pseudotamlana agarivorans TaxID=481183 RepID=UPI00082FCD3F|nr:hypothetical protein [Tamlana agarivorans]
MKRFIILFLIALYLPVKSLAQTQDSIAFPYVLPIWGDKVAERGMADQLQLPFGLNVNYVNTFMDLEITEFGLSIAGHDLTNIVNVETLNFKQVSATTNGLNFRADAWILPFLNVYALVSTVTGGTEVQLQPTWKNSEGEIILQLPEFSSHVDFDAMTYGLGSTLVFGWKGYFSSIDFNYSRTSTALLDNQIGYATVSGRFGHRFGLSKKNKEFMIAPYVGVMYRNFVGARGSTGKINFNEVFPDIDTKFNETVDSKIASNQAIIDDPGTSAAEKLKLQAQNQALQTIEDKINDSGVFSTEIDYNIKKDLVQTVTFQMGFNLQVNKKWMLRGEYSLSDAQRFILTGIQYRFGVKKKEFR